MPRSIREFPLSRERTEFFCAVGDFAVSALSGAEPVETLLLLVAERAIKLFERGLHGLHRAPRLHAGLAPVPQGRDPPRRRAWQRRRTRRLEDVERLRGGVLELVEHGALGIIRLDRLRDSLDRPIGQP